jgi:hypothetical protein
VVQEAKEKLLNDATTAHPDVVNHWKKLAKWR